MLQAVQQTHSNSTCTSGAQVDSKHIHFHMHMHGPTITALDSSRPLQHTKHTNPPIIHQAYSAFVAQKDAAVTLQSVQQQNHSASTATCKAESSAEDLHSGRKNRRKRRFKAVVRALLVSGAATAAVLAGAGAAVVVLSSRVERLEYKCLEVQQHNQQLEQHTSSLSAAKQHLEQQLNVLATAKAALDKQVAELAAHQSGLLQHNQQLANKIEALHDSQQVLQDTADKLHVQVADANAKLVKQQQEQQLVHLQDSDGCVKHAAHGDAASAVLPIAPSGIAAQPGDLSVQVTVPGFTDTLVSRISEADLVPQFATALVAQIKHSNLIGHAVEVLLGRLGQQMSAVLCPWRWGISMPWQQKQAVAGTAGPSESSI